MWRWTPWLDVGSMVISPVPRRQRSFARSQRAISWSKSFATSDSATMPSVPPTSSAGTTRSAPRPTPSIVRRPPRLPRADDETLEIERGQWRGRPLDGRRRQLDEDAAAGPGMQERDATREPGARHGVQQLDAPVLEARQHPVDDGLEAQVVKTLSTLGQETPHPVGGVERLEQLDLRLSGREQGRTHPLVDDRRFLDER